MRYRNDKNRQTARKGSVIYLTVTGVFFVALFILFLFLPRPKYSELERRDLESFPEFSDFKNNLAGFTAGISQWFSNTQPHRDDFLTMSMGLRNLLKLNFQSEEETVSFHASDDGMHEEIVVEESASDSINFDSSQNLAEENAKLANAGIIVAGKEPNVRAMMAFGGTGSSGGQYIKTLNNYAKEFPNQNIYSVIASSSGEFYMPEKVKSKSHSEVPTLEHIKAELDPKVKYVDVHSTLTKHTNEDIFLRTDHHWAPLGAYYAAEALADVAGVPFKDLGSYEKHTIEGYVGSMYAYSKDITVKNSPEDFVYYTPNGLDYKTTFIIYNTNKDFQITGASHPFEAPYFKSFKNGSRQAYLTFMGGDQNLVHVKTGTDSPRKLLVIKDSFGNALPGYLFYSFSDIHVVDFRYFNKNMKKYVEDNGITDIAFVFNIFNVCNSNTFSRVNRFLTQPDGFIAKPTSDESENKTEIKTDSIIPASPSETKAENQSETKEEKKEEGKEVKSDDATTLKTDSITKPL